MLQQIRERKVAVENVTPSSFMGSLWNAYKLTCYQEVEDDMFESATNVATAKSMFFVGPSQKK
jgi:hypothetical protein